MSERKPYTAEERMFGRYESEWTKPDAQANKLKYEEAARAKYMHESAKMRMEVFEQRRMMAHSMMAGLLDRDMYGRSVESETFSERPREMRGVDGSVVYHHPWPERSLDDIGREVFSKLIIIDEAHYMPMRFEPPVEHWSRAIVDEPPQHKPTLAKPHPDRYVRLQPDYSNQKPLTVGKLDHKRAKQIAQRKARKVNRK